MKLTLSKAPALRPLAVPLMAATCLLAVATSLLSGCSKPEASDATPAPSSGAGVTATAAPTLKQQVENDPNLTPERKQQITDSLTRTQQAANDPRALRGRPSPTPTPH